MRTSPLRFTCDQRWEDLAPRGQGRHCAKCDRVVVDLARLTKRQAQPYLQEPGRHCVRLAIRGDTGEVLFRPEPPRIAGVVLAAAVAAGCTSTPAIEPASAASIPDALAASLPLEPTDVPVGVAVDELDPELLELPQNEGKSARVAQPPRPRGPAHPHPAAVPAYPIHHTLGF